MKKLLLSLTLASLLSAGSYAVYAKERNHGEHERTLMASLSLTQQQKEDIKQIRKESKQDLSVYRSEQQQLRENMRSIMQASSWDEVAVTNAINEQMKLNLQSKLIVAKSKNKVFNQLNAEQQAQFIAARDDKKDRKDGKKHKNPGKKMQRIVKALDLNAEQQAKLTQMMITNKAEQQANRAQAKIVNAQLAQIIQAKEFNEDAWLAIYADNRQQKLDMAVNKAKARFEMLSVLSAEQREKFEKIMKKDRKGKMHQQHGRKHGKDHDDVFNEESDDSPLIN
ncbi:MAG: Spy/CpxP family protein refolding chaperone [Pseudoalteromonas sp.]|jgi:Spy/CpxP family protein refolding chaperone